jgi:lipopolysaccharide export system permease protein
MEKGHIVRRLENEAAPQIIAFERYAVDANQLEQRTDQTNIVRPRQRYTNELITPDRNDPIYKMNPGSYSSELHERFASPLYAFAFVLLVVAFMGQAQTTRTSRMQAVIAAFAVAVLSRVLGITCANMVVVRPAAAPLLYAVPAAAALLAAVAIHWHMYPRRPSRVARATRALLESMGAGLAALWPRRRAPTPSGIGA